jgi:flagellar hook-associated protein 2
MAVSSTTSTGINVPEIVSGLMDVERVPVTKLQTQVDQKTLVISTLGVFQSKVSALESAAKALTTPGIYALRDTTSSDATKVSATASNSAAAATYAVKVAQTAQAASISISGFTAATQVVDLSDVEISYAGTTYSPHYAKFSATGFAADEVISFRLNGASEDQTFTVTTQTTATEVADAINAAVLAGSLSDVVASVSGDQLVIATDNPIRGIYTASHLDSEGDAVALVDSTSQDGLTTTATVRTVSSWLNSLGANISSNLVQIDEDHYALSVASTVTGAENTLTLSGLEDASGASFTATPLQSARDAFVSINGLSLKRSSNTIDDVVTGVTFSLNTPVESVEGDIASLADADFSSGTLDATVSVTAGSQDLSTSAVQDFVTAYNELVGFYKTESIASTDPETRGVLNGNSNIRTFMDRLRGLYAQGILLVDGSSLSFAEIGVEFRRIPLDGTLELKTDVLNAAVSNGLQSKLAAGITLGYESDTSNLTSFLTDSLGRYGLLSTHISDVEAQQTRLQERISDWEDKLSRIQDRYYRQYAALDALLFRLQTTSNALASAIDSLVNSQKN